MLLENRMMKSLIDELYSEIKIWSLSKPKNNSHVKLPQAICVLVYNNYECVCDCVLVCVLEERRVPKMNDYFSRFHQYTSKTCFESNKHFYKHFVDFVNSIAFACIILSILLYVWKI